MEEIEELLAAVEPTPPQTSLPLSSEENKPTEDAENQPDPADVNSTDAQSDVDSENTEEESYVGETTIVAQAEALLSEKSRESTGDGTNLSMPVEKTKEQTSAINNEEPDKAELFEDN